MLSLPEQECMQVKRTWNIKGKQKNIFIVRFHIENDIIISLIQILPPTLFGVGRNNIMQVLFHVHSYCLAF